MASDTRLQKKVSKGRHLSAMKRHRQSLKRKARNKHIRSATKTSVKNVRIATSKKDKKGATEAVKAAISQLHKAASQGVIPKRRASRLSSRLTKAITALG